MGSGCSQSTHLFHLLTRPWQSGRQLCLLASGEKPLRRDTDIMEVLQRTLLFLLLSSVCSGEGSKDVQNTGSSTSPPPNLASSSTSATTITPSPDLHKPTLGTSPPGTISNESSKTSLMSTVSSITTVTVEGTTSNDITKNESVTANDTMTNLPTVNAISTVQSPQPKIENVSSSTTAEIIVNTPHPAGSVTESKTSPSLSLVITTPDIIFSSPGTEDGKNMSASSAKTSYSSVILPVVIALIVVTLSVFVLVGLYRMCWKTDPGTQDNGNDQPQSDKESVKLLTVKTISHESGEHSVQGKTKN
ncbi:endomucin [Ochotona princeps]|uniref:endomucin n=1 Tax=Ochotona princeps TaxID=9978 RepID=UPI0027154DF4|nr:endomucin [Ochotona princeps]